MLELFAAPWVLWALLLLPLLPGRRKAALWLLRVLALAAKTLRLPPELLELEREDL